VAGLNAYSKGVSLGLFQPAPREVKEKNRKMRKEEIVTIDLLQQAGSAKHTDLKKKGQGYWLRRPRKRSSWKRAPRQHENRKGKEK
jgi:hypothetical protein